MLCVATTGAVLALVTQTFTLDWTHSVTRTRWHEVWVAGPAGLRPVEAVVQGPGAGMEIPDGATRVPDGWRYRVQVPLQSRVLLASSGTTPSGWRLCAAGTCHDLGTSLDTPVRLWWAEACG